MKEAGKIWIIESNTDLTEGRGQLVIIGYTSSETVANRLARGRGVQGSNAYIREVSYYVDGCAYYVPIYFHQIERPTVEEEKFDKELEKTRRKNKKGKNY